MLVVAFISYVLSMAIVKTQTWHGKHSFDHDLNAVQKNHSVPVPRIGGLALVLSLVIAFCMIKAGMVTMLYDSFATEVSLLVAVALPAFITGLIEDLTKKVSVKVRLFATFSSAMLACFLLDAYLPRLSISGIDYLLTILPISFLITTFLVAGVANSINIIDGFNGLAGLTVVIILAASGYLAWAVNDLYVMQLAIIGIGATIGFLGVNYPKGKLFLGDGGAYFLGFWIAEVAVLLVARNPQINPWQVLGIFAYPVIEVLYSVYRRSIRKTSPGAPDRLHMHTLVYRQFVCHRIARDNDRPWRRNSAVACIIGLATMTTSLAAIGLGSSVPAAIGIVVLDVFLYIVIYMRIVRRRWCFNPVNVFRLRKPMRITTGPGQSLGQTNAHG